MNKCKKYVLWLIEVFEKLERKDAYHFNLTCLKGIYKQKQDSKKTLSFFDS